ncbi:hypothetical protein ACFYKX_05525 [Cytobacillus sp. FJAT-54145]|uniref:Peptidase M48 domain-containing protein n=1 Tax=Cytobacillus spartinae TaxID=3299023 RepID=A0ABW6KAY2_9BACI
MIPNINFALEKLSPESDFLRTIVAHEFGHVAHNILSNRARMNWKELQWTNPLIWLYQEGVATHFSRRTVKDLHPSIYFSFNEEGKQWLAFSEENIQLMKTEFIKDLESEHPQEIFKEWFSINGGQRFGYNRLAYFIGDHLFQKLVHHLGEEEAIIAWKEDDFLERARNFLDT